MRRPPFVRFAVTAVLAVAVGVFLTACADDAPPTAVPPDGASHARGTLRDPGINRNDTHFAARVTTDTDDAIPGALLGDASMRDAAVQLGAPTDGAYVEAGYGPQGELRFGVYWDARSGGTTIAGIRVIGDDLFVLGPSGQVTLSRTFDAHMAATGLPGGSLIGAMLASGPPPNNGCPGPGGSCASLEVEGGDAASRRDAPGDRRTTIVGDVREDRARTRRPPGAAARPGTTDATETVRRYRRIPPVRGATAADLQRPVWRLEAVEQESRAMTDRGERVSRSRTAITYRVWHTNAGRDIAREAAQRAALRATPPVAPAVRPAVLASEPAFTMPTADAGAGSLLCPRGNTEAMEVLRKGRGISVLFQHGFCGNAGVFEGMRPRITAALPVDATAAFSLESTDRIDAQVDDLAQRASLMGGRSFFAVGHSQGGLVIRRLGQRYPALVAGVVTIGTPHQGTYVADLPAEMIGSWLLQAVGPDCVGRFMCSLFNDIVFRTLAGEIGYGFITDAVPTLSDLRTGSPFLHSLNTAHEGFQRAGIEVSIDRRWALARMIGDQRTPRTRLLQDRRPDGEEWVRTVEEVYRAGIFLQVLSLFSRYHVSPMGGGVSCSDPGYAMHWAPCYDAGYGNYWYESYYADMVRYALFMIGTVVTGSLDRIDSVWDYITTRHIDGTDGFIQLSSQRYPDVPGTHPPVRLLVGKPDADSHAGITASPGILSRTLDALRLMTGTQQ